MAKDKYDYLIVGAGLFGSTFAYLARQRGKRCLVIDKRSHVGGNIYTRKVAGIDVHEYGAHIFHTSNPDVWRLVTSLVPFNRFTNSPVALAPDGKYYNLPFNMNTFYRLWGVSAPEQALRKLEEQRSEALAKLKNDGVDAPRNLEEQALVLIGRDIYELLIKGYTEKQWGRPCSELPAFIIKRLPVRLTYDNNYFNDCFQGIPENGYTELVEKMLYGCDVRLGCDFFKSKTELLSLAGRVVFTGRIDEFYDFRFGRLDYRSVRFETEVLDTPNYQGNAVVNYTASDVPYTRVIEHKHFSCFGDMVYDIPQTVVSREFPVEWCDGVDPAYPVNDSANHEKYMRYLELAEKESDVLFGGRLAEYRYYDMAPVIERVMELFRNGG